jgi:hypothetical protein
VQAEKATAFGITYLLLTEEGRGKDCLVKTFGVANIGFTTHSVSFLIDLYGVKSWDTDKYKI